MPEELTSIQRPKRWDVPFWREPCDSGASREMTGTDAARLVLVSPFNEMDPARFPDHTPLREVLLNDTRTRLFRKGEIVVRQGDYGNSAFLVLEGAVRVSLETVDDALIGRRVPQRKSFMDVLAQAWRNPSYPEVRDLGAAPLQQLSGVGAGGPRAAGSAIFLQDSPAILTATRNPKMSKGDLFGEIAALGRTPRTNTVFADEDCELLEIRWQGLRELRLRSPALKEYVDRLYRERSLNSHLRETPMFRDLKPEELERVAAATEFLTFGTFDWHASYKKLTEMSSAERLQVEPIVARAGHYPNGVFLVRSGFARLSETYNHGERTVSYLGRGQVFGFEEIAHNFRSGEQVPFQRTLRAVGYIDVLFVPTHVVEQYVLPTMPAGNLPVLQKVRADASRFRSSAGAGHKIDPDMLEFLVEKRFINGTATMVIDMDRCTRCDDCVRACAATHNNNPRFLRDGPVQGHFMIAHACMHCQDPVCMIGCPTGAIHRDSFGGQVVINDRTCIGCSTCANSCPYENIRMVVARDAEGMPFFDGATRLPIQKAAKCDLCVDQITGPACANACPHDALIRVDARDLDRLSNWLTR